MPLIETTLDLSFWDPDVNRRPFEFLARISHSQRMRSVRLDSVHKVGHRTELD